MFNVVRNMITNVLVESSPAFNSIPIFLFFFSLTFLSHCTITVCQNDCLRRGLISADCLLPNHYYVIFLHNKTLFKLNPQRIEYYWEWLVYDRAQK